MTITLVYFKHVYDTYYNEKDQNLKNLYLIYCYYTKRKGKYTCSFSSLLLVKAKIKFIFILTTLLTGSKWKNKLLVVLPLKMTEKPLNIYSFNANGLGEKNKRKAILNWIKTHHHGVLFLQETHSVEKSEEVWKQEFNCNHIYFSHGTSVSRRVSIIIPRNIDVQILNKISDSNGRFILLHVIINNMELILANIYAPTKDKLKEQRAFVNYVHDTLVNFIDKTMVIGGDWNIYIDSEKDKSGGIEEVKSESSKELSNMIDQLGLIDIYRFLHPDGKHFTWRNKGRAGLVQSRLDFFLVSQHLLYQKLKYKHFPSIMSDHSLINFSFDQILSSLSLF